MFIFTAYQRPFVGMPSEACVGDNVTFTCEVLFANGGSPVLTTAVIARDGAVIRDNTPNHTLLVSGPNTVGVIVSNVTLDDNDIVYTCDANTAPDDFESSLILNVTGTYV